MTNTRAFSAPGKALLAGGYLVLDPQYRSYVVALSSRMHGVVRRKTSNSESWFIVTVRSTQFNGDEWNYKVSKPAGYEVYEVNGLRNPFAEQVVKVVVSYCQPNVLNMSDVAVEIYSDPGYHSVGESKLKKNEEKQFRFHDSTITEVPKTGLGSSAGLVTVLTTCLLSVFCRGLDVGSEKDLGIIHNISQIAHCQAQGKVGSGFDVAAAVFGSIIYQRFDAKLIENLPTSQSRDYDAALRDLIDTTNWNFTHDNITLPSGIRLIMGDVSSGSETTKLVAKVKTWYNENYPRSLNVYREINDGNSKFIDGIEKLTELSKKDPLSYESLLKALDSGSDTKAIPVISQIRQAIDQVRRNFQLMTQESGADIEPPVQTELLNQSMQLKGVLTGVVPGAGGYDAIALVTTESANIPSQTLNNERFSAVTWLDLRQENIGVIEENPLHYEGLQ
ncbi:LANO_0H17172g1_1 [Lachancea nothofagi CBS 11611]|uniref:Phosphomevalonate kinase n=1 Tax=Lachancea nothofagi CBS 11611 TaxID=1266666 RepID=A0A1G4KMV5_9SACH|nr:LANO_0H17172g1_1 [Lachancea nothofagi CBS 11611]